ncbi:hypothetical protein [Bifidobacterium bifidum]|uniref:hypothetical protein n=1 Tax=Bifidobacterium bifidum TaxID=1681 RepID=UPI0012AC58BE|nr:hypothetical protein [Bifidobacterium bifidum]
MTGHVTWDDNIGNVFDNVTDAVDDAAKNVGAAFGKAKGALETFFAVCGTKSSLGTTNEAVLDEIARSPLWSVSGTERQKSEANQAAESVDSIKGEIESSGRLVGTTADSATEYGNNISNFRYGDVSSEQAKYIENLAESANSVIKYVRDQRDSLPGGRLDDESAVQINGIKNAIVSIPGLGWVLDTTGWSDPVGKINMYLGNQREKAAKKLVDEVSRRFSGAIVSNDAATLPVPDSDSKHRSVPDPPTPDLFNDTTGANSRVPGPGAYLGDGAYDLNGDGMPDYYDYNLDGVPDVWVDSDGDGIPDIYDSYDDSDPAQRRNIENATEQVRQNIRNGGAGSGSAGSGNSGSGNAGSIDGGTGSTYDPVPLPNQPGGQITYPGVQYPQIPSPGSGSIPGIPVPPAPGSGPTITVPTQPVVDVDSGMSGSIGPVPGTGFPAGSGSFGVGSGSGAGMNGMTVGGAVGGVALAAGVSGGAGSYFSNVPVHAQVTPSGVPGISGMAAGLGRTSSVESAAGSGMSAGRPGMMGAPGAGAADKSKNRRQGLGYVAPHLEDDDIEIRSVGAMAGHRIKKTDD